MKTLTKAMVGTVAAGAMAVSAATPALAQHDRRHDNDGISAGEVIAGALIIGGIAAIASSASNNRDGRYYDRRGYSGYGNPRQAVSQCVAAAESNARRYTWGRANVTDIRRIDRVRNGYRIQGRIAVQNGRYNDGRRYGYGWGNDYRGWNDNLRGYDAGRFTCQVRNGRVVDLDYSGIRRL